LFRHRFELYRFLKKYAPLWKLERGGVNCGVGVRKNSSIVKPQAQPTEPEIRRGIERWENEGGRLFPRVKRDSGGDTGFARSRLLHGKKAKA
jgi:hypothetical protein